jgi:AcrR family transcriptional regulator
VTATPRYLTGTDSQTRTARDRILDAAYDLFSRRSVGAVGINEVIASASVAKATLYHYFPSKADLVLAFLQEREQRWTLGWVEAESRRRGSTPEERLLAIFDLFDGWFSEDTFEGCSFINVLLETGRDDPIGHASAVHLENIRSVVRERAEEAGLVEVEEFVHSWHILMKGSIVTAAEGDRDAAKRAKVMASRLLEEHHPASQARPERR